MKRFILSILAVISMAVANDINLDQVVIEAKKANKHILVYLHITGCDYCVRMQEFTLDDDMVKAAIKKDFIFVDMNVRDDGLVQYDNFKVSKIKFAKEVGYPIYPSCLFFDQNGELVYDGVGYRDENKFLKELKLVSSKSYNDVE